ncbi:MAG: hypothetical protein R3Y24_16130 [Eubacteriales bacterium]
MPEFLTIARIENMIDNNSFSRKGEVIHAIQDLQLRKKEISQAKYDSLMRQLEQLKERTPHGSVY